MKHFQSTFSDDLIKWIRRSFRMVLAVALVSVALPGCTMLGVELVDSAELAELQAAEQPVEEAVDEAELDDACPVWWRI
jgi:hypothetical protein